MIVLACLNLKVGGFILKLITWETFCSENINCGYSSYSTILGILYVGPDIMGFYKKVNFLVHSVY